MKYKLLDVRNVVEHGVTFGTCELCMHTGTHNFEVYVVEDERETRHEFESGYWDYGDYVTYIWEDIHNVIQFADWFRKQDLPADLEEEDFWEVVRQYIDEVQNVGEVE